jgi:hypothetical protein
MSHVLMTTRVRLGIWRRHIGIVIRTSITKVMEYSSMAAPIYASWGIDTDMYREKRHSIIMTSSKALVHGAYGACHG